MSDRDLSAGAHPESADLVDYSEGRADASVIAEIDRHLEGCEACRELVAALSDYPADEEIEAMPIEVMPIETMPGDPYAVDEDEVEVALRSALASRPDAGDAASDISAPASTADRPQAQPSPPRMPGPSRARPAARRRFPVALPLAAMIVIAVGWGLSERRDRVTTAPPPPIVNVPILELQELGNPLRSFEPKETSISQGILIFLADDDPLPAGLYSLRIEDGEGAVALEIFDLEVWSAGHLSLFLAPDSLPPGDYEVVLIRPDGTPWPRRFVLSVGP